jgi:predicted peptidase
MMRFQPNAWAKMIVLLVGLSGLSGCAGGAQPIAAQGIGSSSTFVPPLATLTPKIVPPTLTPSPRPTDISAATPTPDEVIAAIEPDPAPEAVLGQQAYTTSLQVIDDAGLSRTVDVHYLLYLPGDYGRDSQALWPLIIFLHGASERGDDPSAITRYSIPAFLTNTLDFSFVVLSPQSPLDDWWSNQTDVLNALLNQIQTVYAIDPKRIILTGQSMGGYGTWALALKYPTRFAAIVPVASGWDYTGEFVPSNICDLEKVPIWVFHGALDTSVPPDQVSAMVQALQNCGGQVRFTLYPDADHLGSSNRAYADPHLYEWLAAQHRP